MATDADDDAVPDLPDDAPPASRSSLWLRIALGSLLVAIVVWVIYRGMKGPSVGQAADYRWSVVDLSNKPFDLAQLRGKPVFLNLWATWCPPCVAEFPSIERLAANPRVKDVSFVCIAVSDDPESVRRFVAERGGAEGLTVLLAAGETPPVFETDGIPATFLIAPGGKIVESQIGSAEWDAPDVVNRVAALAQRTR